MQEGLAHKMAETAAVEQLFRNQGDDQVAQADFQAVTDGGRFQGDVVVNLAHFVAGYGGRRRDWPLHGLAQFVAALGEVGIGDARARMTFLLGTWPATTDGFRAALTAQAAKGADAAADGLARTVGGRTFITRYGRMRFLAAVYEFLVGMEGFAHRQSVEKILDALVASEGDEAAVRHAANALGAIVRQYRRAHFARRAREASYRAIESFLAERGDRAAWVIDDAAVLDFWRERSPVGGPVEYETVFDNFIGMLELMQTRHIALAIDGAVAIGQDRDPGADEEDPAEDAEGLGTVWENPLPLFDQPDLAKIKFFTATGERKPLELPMRYGPLADRLPRAFLRLQSFLPVQNGIMRDLRVHAGEASLRARLALEDAQAYDDLAETAERLAAHVARLLLAALHVVAGDVMWNDETVTPFRPPDPGELFERARERVEGPPDPGDIEALRAEARKAHERTRRQGFAGAADTEARRHAFERAAEALIRIAGRLAAQRRVVGALAGHADGLAAMHEEDVAIFRAQFQTLYGDRI